MRIGIDLGGTKIEAILLDDAGRTVRRERTATPRGDYDGTVRAIAGLVTGFDGLSSEGPPTVGVGLPGALCPATGLIKNANSTWINDRPLDRDIAAALGRPVRVANDANCFALSEAMDGAGADGEVVFGVIVGTGCGGGIVVRRHVLTGPNAIAGEWGHHPLPWPDLIEAASAPACYCGGVGCIETWLSGPGMAADHERVTGTKATALEIAMLADRGDAAATATLARYETRMARALAQIVNILDPDVIVLGGGMSNIDRLYETVPGLMVPFVLAADIRTRMVRNRHGDSSGVRGAAWLWPQDTGLAR